MAEPEPESESQTKQTKRQEEQQNDELKGGEEEEVVEGLGRVSESQGAEAAPSGDAEVRDSQLETLKNGDRSEGVQVNSTSESKEEGAEFKEQVKVAHPEVSPSLSGQDAEPQTPKQLESSVSPAPLPQESTTSVSQGVSSAPNPTVPEQSLSDKKVNGASVPEANQQESSNLTALSVVPIVKTPVSVPEQSLSDKKVNGASVPEANQQESSNLTALSVVPTVKTPVSDGYNWRKYGQKQVKSPKGSRSYYKCTFSDCRAKKIECSDHTGHVIEIVNKGMHSHEPPRKNNFTRESKIVSSAVCVSRNIVTEQPYRIPNDSDPSTSSKESVPETTVNPERKRPCSSGSDGNGDMQVKEEHLSESDPKKRQVCILKFLLPLFCSYISYIYVLHAAGDVGISGDGYRWRKYGQKMVKGNSNPRNYYRCTSAGCPVRKHIETAVDNTNAIIITYKGVHDHDMPVPKKRHGPPSAPLVAAAAPASMNNLQFSPSAPLVAAAAPASMNNLQFKKTDGVQNQVGSTQWSVGTEGELTGEALDLGGEKAIESARTLLSIGFEIKPC
ncbi:DNA-binding WRKY [Corchorus olitorius]|uniref:DNA-binding WRKY n=1 Tax=Corchorus olitorius TaxID=93759 RepID=A0A1R3J7X2_9ROSI|nr:DNA-binding WRKY [Corchorus olitorius]